MITNSKCYHEPIIHAHRVSVLFIHSPPGNFCAEQNRMYSSFLVLCLKIQISLQWFSAGFKYVQRIKIKPGNLLCSLRKQQLNTFGKLLERCPSCSCVTNLRATDVSAKNQPAYQAEIRHMQYRASCCRLKYELVFFPRIFKQQ